VRHAAGMPEAGGPVRSLPGCSLTQVPRAPPLALRLTMAAAAARAGRAPDRLSFTATRRLLRRAVPRFQPGLANPARAPLWSTAD
jgi:hypothetical protein